MTRAADSGCCAGNGPTDGPSGVPPIVCTLDAGSFALRASAIRDLARRWLQRAERTPLVLTLAYDRAASNELRDLVAKERQCCAFLKFNVVETNDAAMLTIVAPVGAEDATAMIFDEFCGGVSPSGPPTVQP